MIQPSGITPFELAESRRAKGDRWLTTAYATNQLVTVLQECNTMIDVWKAATLLYSSYPTAANKIEMDLALELATEALKEKKSAEAALIKVAELAEQLGMVE